MDRETVLAALRDAPIVAAVKDYAGLERSLSSDCQVVFVLFGDILSIPGIVSGITMVFIPSVSTFAISKLLGGGKTLLLGDLIEMQFYGNSYNPYLGSAIALVMMVIVLICMAIMNRFGDGKETAVLL